MAPRRSINTYASPGGSQSQNQRRRRTPSPSDEEGSEDGEDANTVPAGDGDGNGDGEEEEAGGSPVKGNGAMKDSELKAKAGQLVRYALFQEYRRAPIRRSDIVKNVIPKTPRAYSLVLARAQSILRVTMGCELYELRQRGKGQAAGAGGEASQAAQTQTQTQATQTQAQRRKGKGRARLDAVQEEEDEEEDDEDEAGAGVDEGEGGTNGGATQNQKRGGSSKTYILRSILPPQLQTAMSNPRPLPFDTDPVRTSDFNANTGGAADELPDSGALIRWEKGDGSTGGHIGLTGIRTVILALVLCSGRVMSDDHLHALLRRLNLERDTILPYISPDTKSEPPGLTLDKYLDLLAKQQYLEKIKIPGPAGNVEGGSVEWRWGNREAEFSEKDAARFIEDIMLDDDSSDEESDPQPRRRRNGAPAQSAAGATAEAGGGGEETRAAKRKKLQVDIIRAAGGALVGDY